MQILKKLKNSNFVTIRIAESKRAKIPPNITPKANQNPSAKTYQILKIRQNHQNLKRAKYSIMRTLIKIIFSLRIHFATKIHIKIKDFLVEARKNALTLNSKARAPKVKNQAKTKHQKAKHQKQKHGEAKHANAQHAKPKQKSLFLFYLHRHRRLR
ncbi:hypothetical protein BKN38_07940 [Helicobacter sp. CLO-3]|nr:hypothetical protein BA723_07020 [Helicobacter sp. CLO-3]OHU81960.1 hypothetical protein BKN38_07940 [Helicobacter sp. CLO-3]